ncbi:glycosyltransferase [Lactobacillus kalixensis]|uniref:Glycosyl transferase, group 2 family protein n=1 Tax=Lactobacillus kalixensis DSM 16043 TaxID=1423763 RepID=A0A0R1UBX7_9LACO|nr:glycosyltransferase [Lactobacillus kalixensis]KRL90893.1 glycosyl transferase, group 2 family protein [Lactobacillus kalixensis DSM 16043]
MKVTAGIVLFNPDINRLKENVSAIESQVDEIIFFDNGSKNISEIKIMVAGINSESVLLTSSKNIGIAQALNEIARYAIKNKYKWLLTLDQDSVVYPNLIAQYKKKLNLPHLGQISCKRVDRNIKDDNITFNDCSVKEVKYCITSGTLINLEALKKINGFDGKLFIDWVDNEVCCALRKAGYKTYELNYKGLLQEMGKATFSVFLRKKIYTPNYPAIRYFYNARNSIYTARKYPTEENVCIKVLQQCKVQIHIIIFEKNKLKKFCSIARGIRAGLGLSKYHDRGLYE